MICPLKPTPIPAKGAPLTSLSAVLPALAALLLCPIPGCPAAITDDDTSGDDDVAGDDDTSGDDDATGDDDSADDDDTTEPPEDDDWPTLALGVAPAHPGVGSMIGATGVTWARLADDLFAWGSIEESPPDGALHVYDWSCGDTAVAGFQAAGVTGLLAAISPRNAWASVDVDDSGADPPADGDVMPRAEHMDDYRAFIHALVERYDGDGVDDMPGLAAPVRHWTVGREWSDLWPSNDHGDYLTLAEATAEEAQAAYPEVRLGTVPLLLWEVFEGNEPTAAEIEARLAGEPLAHNSFAGVAAILDRPDLFDFVAVHSRGDYTEIRPTLDWLRGEMADRGYDHPIWIVAAPAVGPLASGAGFPAQYPVEAAQQADIVAALAALATFEEPAAGQARDWLAARAASGVVHKAATALGEGAVGIQLAPTVDALDASDAGLRLAAIEREGASVALGMLDASRTDGGCGTWTAEALRPAYRNLELLADKLGDGQFVIQSPVGDTEGVRGYRFERIGYALYVLWWEDGVLELPGETEAPTSYSLPLQCAEDEATVTRAVIDPAAPPPQPEQVPLEEDCSLYLELTSVPVFVELFALSE
ncbi:MAG: hypothetical protein QGH45_02615 [Myxococcota bacterium]|nr:hypothetical protein [Myxococcota bacterium]